MLPCNPDKLISKFCKFVLKLLVLVLFFQVNPSVIVMFAMTQRYPVRMSDSSLFFFFFFFYQGFLSRTLTTHLVLQANRLTKCASHC